MKRPYTSESWEKFVELMRKTIRKVTSISTKMDTFESDTNKKVDNAIKDANKKVDDKLAEINDITTGINLIRGSKDFTIGTTKTSTTTYGDGFLLDNSPWVVKHGDDGFAYVEASRSETISTNKYLRTSTFPNEGKQLYTFFGEIKIINQSNANALFCRLVGKNNSGAEITPQLGATYSQAGIDVNKTGVWQPFSFTFDVSSIQSAAFFYNDIIYPSTFTATFLVRKLGTYLGRIVNPEWNASPLDYAPSTVNDITTGINLLRGTRDFKIGIEVSKYWSNVRDDGFSNPSSIPLVIKKDSDGYGVANIRSTDATSAYYYTFHSSAIYGLKTGDKLTVSCDVMFDSDITPYDYTCLSVSGYHGYNRTHIANIASSDENKIQGKWTTHKGTVTINDNYDFIIVYFTLHGQGSVNFKKPIAQIGTIVNPIWSASSFDYQPIFSILDAEHGGTSWTHGLNSGINIVPNSSGDWSNWITPVYNRQNSTGVIANIPYPKFRNIGDIYSCYIEIEFENVTTSQNDDEFRFIIQGSVDDLWSHESSNPIGNWIYYPNYSTFPGKENGVRTLKKIKVINDPYYLEAKTFMIGWRCDYWASGRFRYRCLKIERGYVDYPQWSPYPEDVVTQSFFPLSPENGGTGVAGSPSTKYLSYDPNEDQMAFDLGELCQEFGIPNLMSPNMTELQGGTGDDYDLAYDPGSYFVQQADRIKNGPSTEVGSKGYMFTFNMSKLPDCPLLQVLFTYAFVYDSTGTGYIHVRFGEKEEKPFSNTTEYKWGEWRKIL